MKLTSEGMRKLMNKIVKIPMGGGPQVEVSDDCGNDLRVSLRP